MSGDTYIETATSGGVIIVTQMVDSLTVDGGTWELYTRSHWGVSINSFIAFQADDGVRTLEGHFDRHDCPLSFFSKAAVLDLNWREACWRHAEGQL